MASVSASVSLGAVNERRLRPIYEHLDNGNYKNALHEAEKVLKKQKDLLAAKVLKTIALYRLGRTDEAFALSREVASLGPTDENSLQGLALYYRESHKYDLIPQIYETACSKCPGHEEYLTHLFMSYVRADKPKDMQRVAILLYKHHPKNPYLFWGIMAIVMQAEADEKLGKVMFLPLAERMIEKHIEKGNIAAVAEVRLYLMVLEMLEKHEKSLEVVEGECSSHFASDAESLRQIKLEIYLKLEKWEKLNSINKSSLLKEPDTWNHVIGYLDSLQHLVESGLTSENTKDPGTSSENPDSTWGEAVYLFILLRNKERDDDAKNRRRGPFLAVLELSRRLKILSKKDSSIAQLLDNLGSPVDLITEYIGLFSSKPCCFGDLETHVDCLNEEQKVLLLIKINEFVLGFLTNQYSTEEEDNTKEEKKIQEHLTYLKMQRFLKYHEPLKKEDKLEIVNDLLRRHTKGLNYSSYRPITDVRVVDDYCLLAANIMIDLYQEEGDQEYLWRAIYVLELAKQRSTINFKFKFTLIRLYCEIGVFMPCAQIYDSLDIKHMQQDTLGYIVCHSVSSLGHYQLASQAFEASRAFFISNNQDSLEFMIACFRNGTFHKVSEFSSFRLRVKNSIHSALTITEHTYMDLITQADLGVPSFELMESCCLPKERFHFDKLTDNRDFDIRFDWMPEYRRLTKTQIETSFKLEKLWLRFRELQVRTVLELLQHSMELKITGLQENKDDLTSFLTELEEVVQETKTEPGVKIKFPFHGPPSSRVNAALDVNYQENTLNILRLFQKILNELLNPGSEKELKAFSESVISGIEGSLSTTGITITNSESSKLKTKKKPTNHEHCHGDCDDDHDSAGVTSSPEESTESALTLPVPESLKGLNRQKLERLVNSCELFSLSVLLAYNFSVRVSAAKAEAFRKRRKKKGKQEPLPSIVNFHEKFLVDLKNLGKKVLSSVEQMTSDAESMTLDISKLNIEDNLTNGDSETMQNNTNGKTTHLNKDAPLPEQLVQSASESILNSTNQLSEIIQGRLNSLKVIKL